MVKDDEYLVYIDCCYVLLDDFVILDVENLKVILECVFFFWEDKIVFVFKDGKNVFVGVYGNLICVFVKYIK